MQWVQEQHIHNYVGSAHPSLQNTLFNKPLYLFYVILVLGGKK